MAIYDNKYWLLSHIRNSFISTDDTGMCELVMTGENKDVKRHLSSMESYPEAEESEDEESDFGSWDFQTSVDFGVRERSNTAAQLEKLDEARKKAAKMRHIKWETAKEGTQEDLEDMFVKKEISKKVSERPKSLLTELMKNYSDVPKNPFIEYAKFDGSGQVNIPTKKFKIYISMLPTQQRNYPIHICCVAYAKIQEFIGLILLKYSTTYGANSLLPVTQYGLYITEDDGEVDSDFPCIDPREPVSKFGFTCLSLVEHNKDHSKSVSFPDETTHVYSVEEQSRTRTISSDKTKAEETRKMENDIQAIEKNNQLMEAPLYRSFRAVMNSKVKRRAEVNIGISSERIEIDPVPQKTSKLMPFKQKAVSHPIDTIVWCDLTDKKGSKTTFRIVYNLGEAQSGFFAQTDIRMCAGETSNPSSSQTSANYKHYDFESDGATAQEIVSKIKLIMELKSSGSRTEYKTNRDKKFIKKLSFHVVK